jgi:hypothetical protein
MTDEYKLANPPDVEDEPDDPNLTTTRPFDPDRIRVNTTTALIANIVKRIDFNEIDLAPAFQRKARLWKPENKSRLIESLFLKIPLPVFYVSVDAKDNWSVVDGIQRLTTIYDFSKNVFPLQNLEYLIQLDGKTYDKLPRTYQRRIDEASLVVNEIQDGTPDEVMINIFKRINTGGMALNGQEIRNALNKGIVREFLKNLAQSPAFAAATNDSVSDDRMIAQEMVLRFLAFYLHPWQEYGNPNNGLDEFLNTTMRELNSMSQSKRDQLTKTFNQTMAAALSIFGDNAFRKPSTSARRNPISKALYEAWSVNLALLTAKQKTCLIQRKQDLYARFAILVEKPEFDSAITYSTGVPSKVMTRFDGIKNLILEVLQ